jgi:Holliday junction resolvasome RuvABC ATP-dependent DNA helicase subunit
MKLNTQAIQWQFATTDRGLLFDAFDTRFMKIELKPYTKKEIAQIVQIHNDDLPMDACERIASYYYLVTREALQAATRVKWERDMRGVSWTDAVEAVRIRDGIDQFGLSEKRLRVLKALGHGKKSIASLASAAGVKVEEMEKFILPPMMTFSNDFEPLVETGAGGRYITAAGLRELDRRGIPTAGRSALPKFAVVS